MIDRKILGKTVLVAIVIAFVVATVALLLFRDWAQENSMIMAVITGGVFGLIYPILARKKRA